MTPCGKNVHANQTTQLFPPSQIHLGRLVLRTCLVTLFAYSVVSMPTSWLCLTLRAYSSLMGRYRLSSFKTRSTWAMFDFTPPVIMVTTLTPNGASSTRSVLL